MNRSKTIALTLGPCLAVMGLLAGYLVKTSQSAEPGLPLDLQAFAAPNHQADEAALSQVADSQVAELAASIVETSKIPPSPPDLPQLARERLLPKFDVVRVERRGDAVVAGHAEPNAEVALLSNEGVVARGKADAAGQFVFLPQLSAGEHSLVLSATSPAGKVMSDQHVAVSVPATGKQAQDQDVMVALDEPGKATVLLKEPVAPVEKPLDKAPPPSPAAAKPQVAISTAEVVVPGGFFATGHAAVGARLRIYLNGSPLTDVITGTTGQWSVKIGKGLMPGQYAVRADQLDKKGGVIARAEVPFDYPTPAQKKAASASEPRDAPKPVVVAKMNESKPALSSAIEASAATIAEVQTATVEKGNNLWRISRVTLGHGKRYTEIYTANATQIRDPSLIYPGQIFVIPSQVN